jgi:hypothetical protein
MGQGPATQRPKPAPAAVPSDGVRADADSAEESLPPDELAAAWDEWVAHGPHGPIEDDAEPAFR